MNSIQKEVSKNELDATRKMRFSFIADVLLTAYAFNLHC